MAEKVKASGMLGSDTVVVPLQNGMDSVDCLKDTLGAEHTAGGLCRIFAFIESPGAHHRPHTTWPRLPWPDPVHMRSPRHPRGPRCQAECPLPLAPPHPPLPPCASTGCIRVPAKVATVDFGGLGNGCVPHTHRHLQALLAAFTEAGE